VVQQGEDQIAFIKSVCSKFAAVRSEYGSGQKAAPKGKKARKGGIPPGLLEFYNSVQ